VELAAEPAWCGAAVVEAPEPEGLYLYRSGLLVFLEEEEGTKGLENPFISISTFQGSRLALNPIFICWSWSRPATRLSRELYNIALKLILRKALPPMELRVEFKWLKRFALPTPYRKIIIWQPNFGRSSHATFYAPPWNISCMTAAIKAFPQECGDIVWSLRFCIIVNMCTIDVFSGLVVVLFPEVETVLDC